MSQSSPPGALSGVRVLDLSRILAGPWASQTLGDLGADIIKIEHPVGGDDTRRWGPPFTAHRTNAAKAQGAQAPSGDAGDAAYFLAANRNKKSVAIDFSKPEGADLVRRMAANADIVIENFKRGGLRKYGLDHDALSAINPRLVYCSVTGFGQTGPYADRAGYDYMIQAMGGLMSVTGHPDHAPGGGPMKVGVAVADLFTGLYAANAILAALRHAEKTGAGQYIDVALFDCQIAMLANQASTYLVSGAVPTRLGNAHPSIAPYQVFAARDGYLVLAVGNDRQFARALSVLELDDGYARDPRFAANPARVENRDALTAILTPAFLTRDMDDWLARFEAAGVPAGPINRIDQVFDDPQTKARGMAVPLDADHPGGEQITRYPARLSLTPAQIVHMPPALGAHTDDVLAAYISADERVRLRAAGIIG